MVTDVSLQVQGEAPSGFPRTLPVRVTPACVLGPDVLGELATAAPHRFFFRDALRDQGMCPPHSREPRGRSDPTPGLGASGSVCWATTPPSAGRPVACRGPWGRPGSH